MMMLHRIRTTTGNNRNAVTLTGLKFKGTFTGQVQRVGRAQTTEELKIGVDQSHT